jgi:hypothetical protein
MQNSPSISQKYKRKLEFLVIYKIPLLLIYQAPLFSLLAKIKQQLYYCDLRIMHLYFFLKR